MKKILLLVLMTTVILVSAPPESWAKKKSKKAEPIIPISSAQGRVTGLSGEDARKFEALSQDQKDKIARGQIDMGFNEWMVELALGKPFYGTEHHPVFVDYEQVWLYTRPETKVSVNEERIIDAQTNWPTVHRKTTKKTCNISDYFVLWDRGVVQDIRQANEKSVHGSCTIENEEAFLPIVDGKPVENP